MDRLEKIIKAHPRQSNMDLQAMLDCVNACFECSQICTVCADACLGEEHIQPLIRCIRLNQDCADICATTGRMLVRLNCPDWAIIRSQLQACTAACHKCGNECELHAQMHEHCKICLEACREAEATLKDLLVTQLEAVS
ncbi:MAG: four-helix bundle copper-binding protein [Phycisphaerae bacterium]|nr:four-helix bundle copper-binding protein [Phycisphaerae bacterium]